jgi:TorA maturation chaperone TorD
MKEDLEWIIRIISSCSNLDHFGYVLGIISLFNTKHKNDEATNFLNRHYNNCLSVYLFKNKTDPILPPQ